MKIIDVSQEADYQRACADFRLGADSGAELELTRQVRDILDQVRTRGDDAVREYTERFDDHLIETVADLELDPRRVSEAPNLIDARLLRAMEIASDRIREYASRQSLSDWQYSDEGGMVLGQRISPLDSVGIYVPGGTAAYPSSVLMGAIPAKVAGVGEIIMMTPAKQGQINKEVLAAAALAGVDRVFLIGGAQAIAAMAWGTQTVPAVDKICGPGNVWVAEAKRQVYGRVGVDMIAGPSEIAIIADASARPDWLAADLLAQAEHDVSARAILVSADSSLIEDCHHQVVDQLDKLERASIARQSIDNNGMMVQVRDLEQAADLVNVLAPEHLQLVVKDADFLLPKIRHAGAIFVGDYTAEVFSDYCAGPNHVLPTMRCARYCSPLGTYDFQKRSTVLRADRQSIGKILEPTVVMAEAEGLSAHARAAACRSANHNEES